MSAPTKLLPLSKKTLDELTRVLLAPVLDRKFFQNKSFKPRAYYTKFHLGLASGATANSARELGRKRLEKIRLRLGCSENTHAILKGAYLKRRANYGHIPGHDGRWNHPLAQERRRLTQIRWEMRKFCLGKPGKGTKMIKITLSDLKQVLLGANVDNPGELTTKGLGKNWGVNESTLYHHLESLCKQLEAQRAIYNPALAPIVDHVDALDYLMIKKAEARNARRIGNYLWQEKKAMEWDLPLPAFPQREAEVGLTWEQIEFLKKQVVEHEWTKKKTRDRLTVYTEDAILEAIKKLPIDRLTHDALRREIKSKQPYGISPSRLFGLYEKFGATEKSIRGLRAALDKRNLDEYPVHQINRRRKGVISCENFLCEVVKDYQQHGSTNQTRIADRLGVQQTNIGERMKREAKKRQVNRRRRNWGSVLAILLITEGVQPAMEQK